MVGEGEKEVQRDRKREAMEGRSCEGDDGEGKREVKG